MKTDKIVISTHVNAKIEKVWQYYNQAEQIVNWNFASDNWCCPKVETVFNAGGNYMARMEAKDGSLGLILKRFLMKSASRNG